MLFSSAVQPSIVSLFSSTGSDPLFLFNSSSDQSLPSDSFVHLLHDKQSEPLPPDPHSLLRPPEINEKGEDGSESYGYELDQTVLHIQSPTIGTTYIQCPPNGGTVALPDRPDAVLGIKHPWMHLQGERDDQDDDESESKEPAASPSSSFAAVRRQWGSSSHPPHPTGAIPAAIPTGKYSHVSYVRVYANCRLRRIWFADSPAHQKVPWEFELYSSD
ncbi:unnamed protein product [Cyclocybe aegerita]|uniref:Uncharacterized protein n=1 Tax=Cyclocybe aegerita TaxID=1973307 RepID=A0A8S0WBP3_CYCAE|nr:unnamed protein product [Cyclocybe aegerita]